MLLSTITRAALLVNPQGTADALTQSLLTQILTGVSASFETYLGRQVTAASTTEYLDVEAGQQCFRLKAYPVSAVTSVSFDPAQAWATALASTSYYSPVYDPAGLLRFAYPLSTQFGTFGRALKVVYTGGMAADAAAFIVAYPDIAGAADLQTAFLYHRRNDLGVLSIQGDGGSVSMGEIKLLPEVARILNAHKRRAL